MFVEKGFSHVFDLGEPCPETSWGRMFKCVPRYTTRFFLKEKNTPPTAGGGQGGGSPAEQLLHLRRKLPLHRSAAHFERGCEQAVLRRPGGVEQRKFADFFFFSE
jgi:hypothetical protein